MNATEGGSQSTTFVVSAELDGLMAPSTEFDVTWMGSDELPTRLAVQLSVPHGRDDPDAVGALTDALTNSIDVILDNVVPTSDIDSGIEAAVRRILGLPEDVPPPPKRPTGPGNDPAPIGHTPQGIAIGAWVMKANPKMWDVDGFLTGTAEVHSWRLTPSYRVGLIEPGQPVYLWVGAGGRHASGFWAEGWITGTPTTRTSDSPHWLDTAERDKLRPYVAVDISPLAHPILRTDLLDDPRFASLETIRVAALGNPSILSVSELAALETLIGDPR